jgi:hypothetical protein
MSPTITAETESAQLIEFPSRLAPPSDWQNVDLFAYVALPAIGAQANVISFPVPPGYNGIINAVANNFVGGGWVEGSGNVIWQILVDGAPPPGSSNYSKILGSLGLPANPTKIAGFRVTQNQTLTLVVQNVNIVVAGQVSGGRFLGYLYPLAEETDTAWA